MILAPFLGTFVYVIARGKSMGERDIEAYQAQKAQFDAVREGDGAAVAAASADELAKLADLKQRASSPTPSSRRRRPSSSPEHRPSDVLGDRGAPSSAIPVVGHRRPKGAGR